MLACMYYYCCHISTLQVAKAISDSEQEADIISHHTTKQLWYQSMCVVSEVTNHNYIHGNGLLYNMVIQIVKQSIHLTGQHYKN